jgi:hypothetical protein
MRSGIHQCIAPFLSFLSPHIAALRLNVSYSLPINGEWDFTFWVA